MSRTSLKTVLLNDGNRIPAIGFGAGTALYGRPAEGPVFQALTHGLNHIDGAQGYGNEASLGVAISKYLAQPGVQRSDIWVTTKLGKIGSSVSAKDALKGSLAKLKVDYVDLFLIHTPTWHRDRLSNLWKEFEELKREGLAKSIGVSNFQVEDLELVLKTATVVPAVNQIEYHPYLVTASAAQLELHKKHGIVTASYSGLTPLTRDKGGPVDPVLASVRARLQKDTGKEVTEGQVILKWLSAKDVVAITTTNKESRLKEILDSENLPALTAEEVEAIDKAGSKAHHRHFWTSEIDK